MSYKLKVVNAGNKSDKDAANKINEENIVKLSNKNWCTKEYLETEQKNLDNILHRKFNKLFLLK